MAVLSKLLTHVTNLIDGRGESYSLKHTTLTSIYFVELLYKQPEFSIIPCQQLPFHCGI